MSREFSEEELRALEAEMDKLTVDDVLLQTVVSLLNLGARKAGLAQEPGTEGPEPDFDQLRMAIEGARALLPILEPRHAEHLAPVKQALAQLQMVYAQQAGGAPEGQQPPPQGGRPSDAGQAQPAQPGGGRAQQSGRLWVPGQ
jgi:hypothetical protein